MAARPNADRHSPIAGLGVPMTLHGLDARELMRDVYFRPDFLEIHARHGLDRIERDDFRHAAVEVEIAGSERRDLETPWGYGGPVATNVEALSAGLAEWRARQQRSGRVAEFVRLHPFINPMVLWDQLDMLSFNRPTVLVDLDEPAARWSFYSDSTRSCIRKAQRTLVTRVLAAEEWTLLRDLYEAGLRRNEAGGSYFFDNAYYRALLATPWCKAWVAEDKQGPVAVACFLNSGIPLCHYHLAGGNERSRHSNAAYLLLEEAFCHYAQAGCRWMHLGGGRTTSAADPLLAFKSKFSPGCAHYYIGGMVFDSNAYEQLGGGRGQFLYAGAGTPSPPEPKHGEEAPISLRSFSFERDFSTFFRLRCDPLNIVWTGFTCPPSWTGLRNWVESEIQSAARRIFLVEQSGNPVGYAYAIRTDSGIQTAIGIAQDASGRGVGRRALAQLVKRLPKDRDWQPPYTAWICLDNHASIRAHEAAGFRSDPEGRTRLVGRKQHRWIWDRAVRT